MPDATLEHVNFTVSDPDRTARFLCDIVGWKIRWQGPSLGGGRSVHVGAEKAYLALYSPAEAQTGSQKGASYTQIGGLNHVGLVVGDLDAVEAKVVSAGYHPHSHADYEPGRRFYFRDHDGIEFEIVSYE